MKRKLLELSELVEQDGWEDANFGWSLALTLGEEEGGQ